MNTEFLKKNLGMGITPALLILFALMALSLGLHLYNIQSIGDSNAYYTAAVESMLQSPSNFFFVAAEPGGSVTVDKPPLGLWVEAVFAYFLGVSGFSTSLPNILAGVLGLPLLYFLVRKYLGELAGLVAALTMTLTPVYLATNRNNTMDGMLVFTLLLAAWAFMAAAEYGKLRWLLAGAFIVGLGFNIKMAQAFLPLPAFYALYFFASKEGWLKKILQLGAATLLMLVVSLTWALIVDAVPADLRPYIGSSSNNSVMGLIMEHNGGSRLVSGGPQNAPQNDNGQAGAANGGGLPQGENPPARQPPQEALNACANQTEGSACSFTLPNGNSIDGACITPPNLNQLACAPQGLRTPPQGAPQGRGGTPFSQETGEPGALRFFTSPLSKQMSWLLPFALISLALTLFAAKIKLPLEDGMHKALILWGGWLLTCLIFFSMVSGIFHSYYAIMLVPPLAAMTGAGVAALFHWSAKGGAWVVGLALASAAITLAFQAFATYQYGEISAWMFAAALLFGAGVMLAGWKRRAALLLILSAMLVVPAYWTLMTVSSSANQNLPSAYGGANSNPRMQNIQRDSNLNEEMLNYLQANTQGMKYLLAVPSSQQGAQIVLASGRAVLYMGGFGGQDDVVTLDGLKQMITNGELRYVLYGGERGKVEIANWLQTSCVNMADFAQGASPNGQGGQMFLYRCE